MATTYLDAVNNVLTRLRESTVSSVGDTPYSSLMGVFVNDAKREIENAFEWSALRTTIQFSTVADTRNYPLVGSTQRLRVLDVINDTQDLVLNEKPQAWINRQYFLGTQTSAAPTDYCFAASSSTTGEVSVDLYPRPDGVYVIRFEVYSPQEDLSSDSTVIKVPAHLVCLLAHAKAVAERGEDGGQTFADLYMQYRLALADHIAIERNRFEDMMVWEAV